MAMLKVLRRMRDSVSCLHSLLPIENLLSAVTNSGWSKLFNSTRKLQRLTDLIHSR